MYADRQGKATARLRPDHGAEREPTSHKSCLYTRVLVRTSCTPLGLSRLGKMSGATSTPWYVIQQSHIPWGVYAIPADSAHDHAGESVKHMYGARHVEVLDFIPGFRPCRITWARLAVGDQWYNGVHDSR